MRRSVVPKAERAAFDPVVSRQEDEFLGARGKAARVKKRPLRSA